MTKMNTIDSLEHLRTLYDAAVPGAITKVTAHLTPLYRQWIDSARFVVLSTVGSKGTDASPRGDSGSVVRVIDSATLWLPDWRGNNRLDSLENIVIDGRVSLMFMVPGSDNVVRVNGHAVLTDDATVTGSFQQSGKSPKTVIVISIQEVYFQCAKALMRSKLWDQSAAPTNLPTAGQFLREQDEAFDAPAYDAGYADYAKDRMW